SRAKLANFSSPTNPESVRGCSTTELPWRILAATKVNRWNLSVNARPHERFFPFRLFLSLSVYRPTGMVRARLRGSGRQPLLLWLRDIWCQIFLVPSQCSHEAHSAAFSYRTHPAFLMNIAPSGKPQHRARFHVPLRGEKK